jgi:outer membrane protein assembly factor BamB
MSTRTRKMTTVLLALGRALAGLGGRLARADDADGDVPMFRGNAARTGEMPGPGPEGNPVEAWRLTTNGPAAAVHSVIEHEGTVYAGSDIGLHALDAANGSERRRFTTGAGVNSSPAVADSVVNVGSLADGVYALDAETGSERSQFAT